MKGRADEGVKLRAVMVVTNAADAPAVQLRLTSLARPRLASAATSELSRCKYGLLPPSAGSNRKGALWHAAGAHSHRSREIGAQVKMTGRWLHEAREGLADGEVVVADGHLLLNNDSRVSVLKAGA